MFKLGLIGLILVIFLISNVSFVFACDNQSDNDIIKIYDMNQIILNNDSDNNNYYINSNDSIQEISNNGNIGDSIYSNSNSVKITENLNLSDNENSSNLIIDGDKDNQILLINSKINTDKAVYDLSNPNIITINPGDLIQKAIDDGSDGDIILLNPGTYIENNITITKNIIIKGNGDVSSVIINGNNTNTIFSLTNLKTTVEFYNITFINGRSYKYGGAIFDDGADLIVDHCNFYNNTVESSYSCGGAITIYDADYTISNSKFINNSALKKDGGAVHINHCFGDIINSTFINNFAGRDGGGVSYSAYSECGIYNSTFINNTAIEWGGGFYMWLTTIVADNCYIENNTGSQGAGIMPTGPLTLTNSYLINNHANQRGGALYVYDEDGKTPAIINLKNNAIYGNTAIEGYDIYVERTFGGKESNLNNNWWGVNDPLNTTAYINWSKRYYDPQNVLNNITDYYNFNVNVYQNDSKSIIEASLNGNGDFKLNLPLIVCILNETHITNLSNNKTLYIIDTPINNIDGTASLNYQTLNFTVKSKESGPQLITSNLTMDYKDGSKFICSVYDKFNNPINGTVVTFTVNGREYNRTTNINGIAQLNINLKAGTYLITSKWNNLTNKNIILIKPWNLDNLYLDADNLNKYYKNGSQYLVKLTYNNKTIAGYDVIINVNGVNYTRTTNNEGIAKLNINLGVGNYLIKSTVINKSIESNINIIKANTILNSISTNITRGDYYNVILSDYNSYPISGEIVHITVNGVTYHKITNNNGLAQLKINLTKSNYIVTSNFNGDKNCKGTTLINNMTVV